jgi:coenzyme F420-reducing hydrogenase gamma subunit
MKGYCVKCRQKCDMKDPIIAMTARGGYMAKGKCSNCGTSMSAMLSKEDAEKSMKSGEAKKGFK